MKKTHKILIGIISVIILVAVVKFALTLRNSTYHTEDKPEDVAFNYLFAMLHKDYERAYGYLSPDIDGYPKDIHAFIQDIHVHKGNFYGLGDSTTLEIGSVKEVGSYTDVDIITDTAFTGEMQIAKDHIKGDIVITLQHSADGKWKIVNSGGYWFICWNTPNDLGCEDEHTNTSSSTFIPPSSSPVLASVEETQSYISGKGGYMQALLESGFSSYATTFPDQALPYHPGDIFVYKISLSEFKPALWVHEECAPTQENLDEIFSNITVEFILNNELVPLNNFALIESKFFDGTPCREYVALVNHWTAGEHLFETHVTYKKSFQNIGSGQLAGTYIWKYFFKVQP